MQVKWWIWTVDNIAFLLYTGRADFGKVIQSQNPVNFSPPTASSAEAESESSAGQSASPNIPFDRFAHLDADDFYIVKPSTES